MYIVVSSSTGDRKQKEWEHHSVKYKRIYIEVLYFTLRTSFS